MNAMISNFDHVFVALPPLLVKLDRFKITDDRLGERIEAGSTSFLGDVKADGDLGVINGN